LLKWRGVRIKGKLVTKKIWALRALGALFPVRGGKEQLSRGEGDERKKINCAGKYARGKKVEDPIVTIELSGKRVRDILLLTVGIKNQNGCREKPRRRGD